MKPLSIISIFFIIFFIKGKTYQSSQTILTYEQTEKKIIDDSISVESIKNIKEVPYIQNCNDKIFWGLVMQGKKNIPQLIEKLADQKPLKHVYVPMFGGEYTVADVALMILYEKIKGIPIFELIGIDISKDCGYCSYWFFIRESKKNRLQLQKEFKKWYKENENKLVWVESSLSLNGDCFSPAKGHYEIPNEVGSKY